MARDSTRSVLDELRGLERRVATRLRELAPLVAEYEELRAVAERLGLAVDAPGAGTRRATKSVGAQRREDVLRVVRAQPGITVAQLGRELSVDRTALYRVVRRLQADGRLVKHGTSLRPA
jgi:hypothetical protein